MHKIASAMSEQISRDKNSLVYWTSLAAVGAAALMAGVKIYGWYATGSIVMLAALLDSLIDGVMSVFIFFSVRFSQMPADDNHRFGHGKAEAIAAFAQSLILAGAALFLFWKAAFTVYEPQVIQNIEVGIYASAICMAMTLVLVAVQTYTIRRTGSLALRADTLHYRSDILLYLSAMVTLALADYSQDLWLDGLFGVGVAIYLGWQAGTIFWASFSQLMDEEMPPATREQIKEVVLQTSEVRGIHDLRTRVSGQRKLIQFHIEMDGTMTLYRAHDIADGVEATLMKVFPDADIIIHQDPEGLERVSSLEKT